jgi:hypothetical protein
MEKIKNYVVGAIGAALFMAAGTLLPHSSVNAATKSTAPERGYYLTTGLFDGSGVLSACTAGYHTASMWEIHEPSNLRYETAIGQSEPDDGNGPPSNFFYGWIRTGTFPGNSNFFAGASNCNLWTDPTNTSYGTAIALGGIPWTSASTTIAPWVATQYTCNTQISVWCVQD